MTSPVELLAGSLLAVLAVVFVGWPLYVSRRRGRSDRGRGTSRMDLLLTQRESLYEAIREVDLDLELGRVTEEDHARHRQEYVAQAAQLLRQIDALQSDGVDRRIEREVARVRDGRRPETTVRCSRCGAPARESDRFCTECGTRLQVGAA